MKRYFALLIFANISLLAIGSSTAQAQTSIRGAVLQDGTKASIEQVEITNLRSRQRTLTNPFGLFSMDCLIGDSLRVERIGYQTQKVAIKDFSDILIRLKITNQLKEVAITGKRASQHFKEIGRAYSKEKGIFYGGKPPIGLLSPFGGSPVTFFYELLSKDGRRVRRLNQLAKKAAQEEELTSYFNDLIIQQAAPIDSNELELFKQEYTPEIGQLKKWTPYDRAKYIRASFEAFRKKHSKRP